MAAIEVSRVHALGVDAARAAVESVAKRLQQELSTRYSWQGDRLEFNCPGAEGCIDISANDVRVSVDLSWLLRPARGRIEKSISEYLDEYLI